MAHNLHQIFPTFLTIYSLLFSEQPYQNVQIHTFDFSTFEFIRAISKTSQFLFCLPSNSTTYRCDILANTSDHSCTSHRSIGLNRNQRCIRWHCKYRDITVWLKSLYWIFDSGGMVNIVRASARTTDLCNSVFNRYQRCIRWLCKCIGILL